ncbi:MAG: LysE family transporter [Polaromonas sp.]
MFETLLTIALLHWVVLVTPGVNFVLLAQLSATGNRSSAAMAVAGITTATLTWATLAVCGVGVIFTAHPVVRQLAQLVGGGYLLYVAWRLWRSKPSGGIEAAPQLSLGSVFRLGFITNMLNPKPALFFGSVFVTTLPANAGYPLVAAAVALVYLNAVLWHLFLALAFSTPGIKRRYERFSHVFNRTASVLVGAFGLKLVLATLQEYRAKNAS